MKQLATLVFVALFAMQVQASDEPDVKAGIGLGIPYGFIGGNVEIAPTEQFAVSFGAGIGFEKPAFSFGGHLLIPNEGSFKPRLSAYFSTAVAAVEVCEYSFYGSDGGCEYEQFAGTAVGVGFVVNHFHAEFLVTNSPAFEDRKDELEEEGADLGSENSLALVLAYRF